MKKRMLLLDKEVLTGENVPGRDGGTGNLCWAITSYITGKLIDISIDLLTEGGCGSGGYTTPELTCTGYTDPNQTCTVLPSDTPAVC
jgi:hypothetical protein